MSNEKDEIIAKYMASLDDDETQNYRVEVNWRRQHSTISNVSAMLNRDAILIESYKHTIWYIFAIWWYIWEHI